MIISEIYEYFMQCLFPPRCPFCDDVIVTNSDCCLKCKTRISKLANKHHINFKYGHNYFDNCIAAFYYSVPVSDVICTFKFRHKTELGKCLAKYLYEKISCEYASLPVDMVLSVPVVKKNKRYFDHANMLAKYVAIHLTLPIKDGILVKKNKFKTAYFDIC